MTSLDTNIVVRLIVGDDLPQARAAERLIASRPCRVAPSVLMECEWVLRASYELDSRTIAAAFRDLLDLENIEAAEPALTTRTLAAFEAGIDFADALHAAQCVESEDFATFDRKFAARAANAGLAKITLVRAAAN